MVQLHTFLYDQEQYDAPSSVKEISNYIAQKPALESLARIRNLARMSARKAVVVEDRPEERQSSLLSPAQTESAAGRKQRICRGVFRNRRGDHQSSAAEETEETETSSGVISAPQDHPGSTETTASDHTSAGPGTVCRARIFQWTGHLKCSDRGGNQRGP